ncbi:MAG: LytR C-terminal domain-containing protein [Actinomycetota bacterium]
MQADHHADDPDAARVGLVRGILVIVTAVAVGGFVLAQGGFGSSDETVAADATEAAEDVEEDEPAEFTSDEIEPATEPTTDSSGGNALEPVDDDESMGGVSDGGEDGDGEVVMPSTSLADPADPAGPAQVEAADVQVVVLNAEGTKGIAGEGSEVLRAAGYDVLAPKNADLLASESAVLYTGSAEAEAVAVAAAFGADASIVAALDPASPPINDIGPADVVVVIGQDGALGL